MVVKKLLPFLILILCFTALQAGVSVKSSVNKHTLYLSDTLVHTIRITTDSSQNIPAPAAPEVNGLRLINQSSSTESRMSVVNMRYERSVVYNYLFYYKPTRTGRITIPQTKITVKNNVYYSQSITVEVLDGGSSSPPADPYDPFGTYDYEPGPEGESFVLAMPEAKSVFVGEPVVVTYYLYTTQEVRSLNLTEEKDFEGYGKSLYEQPQNLNFERTTYHRKSYKRSLLKKMVLYPHLARQIQVPQLVGSIRYLRYGFQNRGFRSQPAFIQVRELPSGAPKGYSGAIGVFSLSQRLSDHTLKLGEAVVLTIQINGKGNFNQFTAPKYPSTSAYQVSTPKIKDQLTSGIQGVRLLQYTIIPKVKGEIKLPAFKFSWLDSKTGRYMSFSTKEQTLSVKPGSLVPGSQPSRTLKELQMLGLSGKTNYQDQGPIYLKWWFWSFLALIILSLIPSFYLYDKRRQQAKDPKKWQHKQLQITLKQELQRARKAALNKDPEFFQIAQNATQNYLNTKYDLPAHLCQAELMEALAQNGVDAELIALISSFFTQIQAARYAPTSQEQDPYLQLSQALEQIATALEQA